MSRLVIIRGNSGSGKTTVATKLRPLLGENVMLISQDVIRREVMYVSDDVNNPAIALIESMALYGLSRDYDVIIEGILGAQKYGEMLKRLVDKFDIAFAFYLDATFEQTLSRHSTKSTKGEFGETQMRKWWLHKDYLNIECEYVMDGSASEDGVVALILDRVVD